MKARQPAVEVGVERSPHPLRKLMGESTIEQERRECCRTEGVNGATAVKGKVIGGNEKGREGMIENEEMHGGITRSRGGCMKDGGNLCRASRTFEAGSPGDGTEGPQETSKEEEGNRDPLMEMAAAAEQVSPTLLTKKASIVLPEQ